MLVLAFVPTIASAAPNNRQLVLPNVVSNRADEVWPTGQVPTGVGFFVSSDGYFLTAAHIAAGCKLLEIFTPSHIALDATLIGMDTRADLALLYAPFGPFPLATFANSPLPDTPLMAVAYGQNARKPQDPLLLTLQPGSVDKDLVAVPLFRFPEGVPRGTSGSPLFDAKLSIHGMVIGRTSDGTNSFAISNGTIKAFLGYFGVNLPTGGSNQLKIVAQDASKYALLVQCQQ